MELARDPERRLTTSTAEIDRLRALLARCEAEFAKGERHLYSIKIDREKRTHERVSPCDCDECKLRTDIAAALQPASAPEAV